MLYMVFKSEGEFDREIRWHIGEQVNPQLHDMEPYLIQADGDELNLILDSCAGIRRYLKPINAGGSSFFEARVMKWFGEDAMFIYHNIILK